MALVLLEIIHSAPSLLCVLGLVVGWLVAVLMLSFMLLFGAQICTVFSLCTRVMKRSADSSKETGGSAHDCQDLRYTISC